MKRLGILAGVFVLLLLVMFVQRWQNRAGDLAKKVEGVKEVENNITVKESVN